MKNLHLRAYRRMMLMAKRRGKPADTSGYHGHHAFPKSIFKKTAARERRIVWLTYGEHFQAHHMLYRALKVRYGVADIRALKMATAVGRMATKSGSGGLKDKLNLKQFEQATRIANEAKKNIRWVTNGQEERMISKKDPAPEGFGYGRLSQGSPYNNGVDVKFVKKGDEPPQGFINKGFLPKGSYYNNGLNAIVVKDGDEPPAGYKKGGLTPSDQAKVNIGIAGKKRFERKEEREKMAAAQMPRWNDKAARDVVGERFRGAGHYHRVLDDGTVEKKLVKEDPGEGWVKGRWFSPEHRAKLDAKAKERKSEETKRKIAETLMNKGKT